MISLHYTGKKSSRPVDVSSMAIKRNPDKCIMCRRCETACNEIQTVGVLSGYGRGFDAVVAPPGMKPLEDTVCVFCGQCVNVCPTAALTEMSYIREVWRALGDPSKTVICQTAPAVRSAIGQEFHMPEGEIVTGRLVAGLKKLGFDAVFDTNFTADLTIVEEALEIVDRITKNENLPVLTSCCPGWINFLEYQFPDLINIPSSCKSPQQMFGTVAKTWYAQKIGIDPGNLVVVSIMPCLAKKYEAARPEFTRDGTPDVDYVISTRELARMFREAGINIANLKEREFDDPLGESTGAADIFAVTGGVLEAALRTAYHLMTGRELEAVEFAAIRGMAGIREAEIDIDGKKLSVAVSSGLGNARELLKRIRSGKNHYHAIEIMACPGGCINGGGQPYIHGDTGILKKRMETIYKIDSSKSLRRSHENPSVRKLYSEFLGRPGGEKAHELLHTVYSRKSKKAGTG
jgi:NADH-quinone oxidoreductase subunit G